jgi:hypothetical protein
VESTNEQATTKTAEAEKPGNEGGSSGQVATSVIAELEARRAALDAAIQELKRGDGIKDIPQLQPDSVIPPTQ